MSSRNAQYKFIPTDPSELEAWLLEAWEAITGHTALPASPERLYIQWVKSIVIQERVLTNYTANQNIPSRAEGANLDALAELFYEQARPAAEPSVCTMRFTISEPQETSVLIPGGTRVSDSGETLYWETLEDHYIPPGEATAEVRVRCQTAGTQGNGFAVGQITKLVDIFDYYLSCTNITETGGGADVPDDDTFFELLRASMDGYSCAGSLGGYAYFAKRVSPSEIADVCPNSPTPGVVYIYVLMANGEPAGEEMKKKVFDACNAEKVRAFTDDVHMGDPEIVPYDIDLTYYIQEDAGVSADTVEKGVATAIDGFVAWQNERLGRDINPSKLSRMVMSVDGVKRVDLRAPAFTVLRDGKMALGATFDDFQATVPQVAKVRSRVVLNGGYENE